MSKPRLRDLGIIIGTNTPGPLNGITDVPGVLVGQATVIRDAPAVTRTGVTAIFPRQNIHQDYAFAGHYTFNGIGEMTGLAFVEETGLLTSPILLANTNQLGMVYDAVIRYGFHKLGRGFHYKLPVVAETWDGWLNDSDAFPLQAEDVFAALDNAGSGPVAEGNCGGGTGMICYEFKGGTGTASRQVEIEGLHYTVGALVQANHGERDHLRVDGVPVGQEITKDEIPSPWIVTPASSSIIVLLATDAPLLPHQCTRLAQRATVGLARTGGYGLDGSGDIFLAFTTGIHYEAKGPARREILSLAYDSLDKLIVAAVEAIEEAILNVLVAAETMTGMAGHVAHGLPPERLVEIMRAAGRLA